MPNPYFQFKQFTVYHDQCAMKVGIDGVLLGAWAPVESSAGRILDIGTGSGLIALMLAQRSKGLIDAIDIDEGAVIQANKNIADTEWSSRITVHKESLQGFAENQVTVYDLIVSNPPYFISSMKAPDEARSKARHTDFLTHEELLKHASELLNKTGRICIILPVIEGLQCMKSATKYNLYCYQCVYVYPKPNSEAKRVLLEFGLNDQETRVSTIEIETGERHQYSAAFTALAKDFYLKL
jgi:tRNA1Val (adenine37-N6)-methyltransferase